MGPVELRWDYDIEADVLVCRAIVAYGGERPGLHVARVALPGCLCSLDQDPHFYGYHLQLSARHARWLVQAHAEESSEVNSDL